MYTAAAAIEAAGSGRAASRLECPEGYRLTAATPVEVVHRAMSSAVRAGFQTPSTMYGPDLMIAAPDVTRIALE